MIIELKLFVYSGTLHCQTITITIIKANCSRSTGRLLRRHENRTGYGFCSQTRTVISERFLWQSEAAPRAQFARTGIRTVAEVNKYKRGLERIETSKYSGWGLPRFSSTNPLGQPLRHDVRCVWMTCSSSLPLLFILYRVAFLVGKKSTVSGKCEHKLIH